MKLKDLLGRVDKRKAEVLKRGKFTQSNKAREVVGKTALEVIAERISAALERVLRFPSNLASWSSSSPGFAPELPAPQPEPVIATALIEFSAVPDSGVWQLAYDGDSGLFINSIDGAAEVQTALQAIAGLESATVTGDYSAGFTVVLGEDKDVALLTVPSSNLEAASVPVDITITDITE